MVDLQHAVADLQLWLEKLVMPGVGGSSSDPERAPASGGMLNSADLEKSFTEAASGQFGHGKHHHYRSDGSGVHATLEPPPVTGTRKYANLTPIPFKGFGSLSPSVVSQSPSYSHAIPPLDFPRFDGTNPKLWVRRCENYFDVCATIPEHWVKLALMHFIGSAAFWMQSIEVDLRQCSWKALCQAVIERFEKDQYNHLVRQFFHIKQSGTVAEYVEVFDELVHQILAHDPAFNPSVITTRFVDGLKPEIKVVVLIHRPKDLDTASSLAILQEEVLMGTSSRELKKFEAPAKATPKWGNNSHAHKPPDPVMTEERKFSGSSRSKPSNDRIAALMAYRKAKGLCYKCGAKWGPQHTCSEQVPLHLVEELWQMVSYQDGQSKPDTEGDSDSSDDLMAISAQAVSGTYTGKTVRLRCSIQQHEIQCHSSRWGCFAVHT